jgi:hypothetical protein
MQFLYLPYKVTIIAIKLLLSYLSVWNNYMQFEYTSPKINN